MQKCHIHFLLLLKALIQISWISNYCVFMPILLYIACRSVTEHLQTAYEDTLKTFYSKHFILTYTYTLSQYKGSRSI